MSANTETKKLPVEKIRVGSVTAAIWENESGTDITFQRTYKNKEGQYRNSNSYRNGALLELAHAALKAYDRLEQVRNAKKEAEEVQPQEEEIPY